MNSSTHTTKNIKWSNTPNMGGADIRSALYQQVETLCGEQMYGLGRGRTGYAYKNLLAILEKTASNPRFLRFGEGRIISNAPSIEICIAKLIKMIAITVKSCDAYIMTDVEDTWAKVAGVRSSTPMKLSVGRQAGVHRNRRGPRFTKTPRTTVQIIDNLADNCVGTLSEGFVIAHLNKTMACPECRVRGQIGWCDSASHISVDAFRDGVCMSCKKMGVNTLFEIKCRWESAVVDSIKSGSGTSAGSYVALNALMTTRANVYLVLASRDTGTIRVGKITSARLRGNNNWMYSVQEKLGWGGPSSMVQCAGGIALSPHRMTPLIDTLSPAKLATIVDRSTGVYKKLCDVSKL